MASKVKNKLAAVRFFTPLLIAAKTTNTYLQSMGQNVMTCRGHKARLSPIINSCILRTRTWLLGSPVRWAKSFPRRRLHGWKGLSPRRKSSKQSSQWRSIKLLIRMGLQWPSSENVGYHQGLSSIFFVNFT